MRQANVGAGAIVVGTDLDSLMMRAAAEREPMTDLGLRFVRRLRGDGYDYFIVNWSDNRIDAWVPLGVAANSLAILDPMSGASGVGAFRRSSTNQTQVYLQLLPHQSCIVHTSSRASLNGTPWPYRHAAGDPIALKGTWNVQFTEGGPNLPQAYQTSTLASWTTQEDPECKRFAGTVRYRIEFDRPGAPADDWRLDLGAVHESARVRLNGREMATLFAPPFALNVGPYLQAGKNVLEVDVTNLAANRIADMDRRKVKWKYFYDANVAPLGGRGVLDASRWPLRDSGLLGPVTLQPMRKQIPQ